MEKDFAAKLRLEQPAASSLHGATQRATSMSFRAPQENFTIQDFELGKIYGIGSYSKVAKAKKKDTGNVYALKIMDKNFITKEKKTACAKLERIVLDQLDHPGIIRLDFTFQDAHSVYMALESCEGGELFDQIVSKGCLSENEARFYTAEVIDALEYLHGLGLIHRDIKPENLLLTADGHIKIADFGSVKLTKDSHITVPPNALNERECTFVGTPAYVPPEVLNSSPATYGHDLWALGCTLYQMLYGASPFLDATEWLIFQRIIARDLTFPDYFSDEASDLIDKLLDIDPSKRLGAGPGGYAALKIHPFFKGIDWGNLRKQSVPKLALEASKDNDAQGSTWNMAHIGDGPTCQQAALDGSHRKPSASEAQTYMSKISKVESFDSKWQDFLEPGESALMISKLKKLQKLRSKKVLLILTDKAKLIYVDPSKLMGKGKVLCCGNPGNLNVHVANSSHFKICTPNKVLSFEDAKQQAWQWKKMVEGLQKR